MGPNLFLLRIVDASCTYRVNHFVLLIFLFDMLLDHDVELGRLLEKVVSTDTQKSIRKHLSIQ